MCKLEYNIKVEKPKKIIKMIKWEKNPTIKIR